MNIWDASALENLIKELQDCLRKKAPFAKEGKSICAPRIVFVCGKKIVEGEESIRKLTIEKLQKFFNELPYGKSCEAVLCVMSEDIYVQDLAEDIFSFEKMLAEISEKIIIIAESPGSFCELGAFIMDEECSKKSIIIDEDLDGYKDSFIMKGPIRMKFLKDERSVILHYGINRLKDSTEYNCCLENIANEKMTIKINKDPFKINLRSLIYELANIVEIFQPIDAYEIEMLYKRLMSITSGYTIANLSEHKIKTISKVIILMDRMGMINKENGYYFINPKISCYNVLFKIGRKEFNDIRIRYLSNLEKLQPQRIEKL